jgi:hypothetical protein
MGLGGAVLRVDCNLEITSNEKNAAVSKQSNAYS